MNILPTIKSATHTANTTPYYRTLLPAEQQKIYSAIASGLAAFSKSIKIPLRPINELSKIFNYVLLDNPLLFYATSFSCQNDLYKKKCSFVPEYSYEKAWVKEKTAAVIEGLKVFDAVRDKSDLAKELYVHDYCLGNITYDNNPDDLSHALLGPALRKTGVCDGIAKYVKLALDYLGVKCIVVSGKARSPTEKNVSVEHAWNIVEIDRRHYHLDVTFDITLKQKANRYDYFNLSDGDIEKDHTIIGDAPVCAAMGKDYYSINKLLARRPAEAEKLIYNYLRKGERSIVFRIVGAEFSDKVVDKIKRIAEYQCGNLCKGRSAIEIIYNPAQMVFEINFS